MKIYRVIVGSMDNNCYLIETNNKNCIIIDPGADSDKIITSLEKHGLIPKIIMITHGHYDHFGAIKGLLNRFSDLNVYIGEGELDVVDWAFNRKICADCVDALINNARMLKDGEKVQLGEIEVTAVHTPGHSKGGMVYIIGGDMFSGDTLFKLEIGRCDLETGDFEVMQKTLKKLSKLVGDFKVHPGHGEPTSLEYERKYNPYMSKVI